MSVILHWLVAVSAAPIQVLNCPRTEIVIHTTESWSVADQAALDAAMRRCKQIYQLSPCVKKFIRSEQLRYSVVCGATANQGGPRGDL